MSVTSLARKQSEKRAKELNTFLLELDGIADKLYSRLEFKGVWDVIEKLEDVRIRYYCEYHEHRQLTQKEGK